MTALDLDLEIEKLDFAIDCFRDENQKKEFLESQDGGGGVLFSSVGEAKLIRNYLKFIKSKYLN